MRDKIQSFIFKDLIVHGKVVCLSDSFTAIMAQHYYPKPVRQFLAEVLLGVALLRATIKLQGRLTIQLEGESVIELLVAQCDNDYRVRAVAQWDQEADVSELEEALMISKLVVTVMPQKNVAPYQAIVSVGKKTVAKALEEYFVKSEQVATKFWLHVEESQAVGFMLQKLPKTEQQNWRQVIDGANKVKPAQWLAWPIEKLLATISNEGVVKLFEAYPLEFSCHCSVEKMAHNVRRLGKEEAFNILKSNK